MHGFGRQRGKDGKRESGTLFEPSTGVCSVTPPAMQGLRLGLPRAGIEIVQLPRQDNTGPDNNLGTADVLCLEYESKVAREPQTDVIELRVTGWQAGLGAEPTGRVLRLVVHVMLWAPQLALLIVCRPENEVGVTIPGWLVREVGSRLALIPVTRLRKTIRQGRQHGFTPSQHRRTKLVRVADGVGRVVLANHIEVQPHLFGGPLGYEFPVARVVARQCAHKDIETHVSQDRTSVRRFRRFYDATWNRTQ